jgi:16S rRNA processing protein RimM
VNDEPDFVVIGLLRRAHGVQGEVSVQSVTDVPDRFDRLTRVLLRKNGRIREVGVEAVGRKGKAFVLKLDGVDDRDAAQALAGGEIGIRRGELRPLSGDTYYVFDLVGCKVVGKNGGQIGVIEEVWKMPANDVLVVMSGTREILIPAIKSVVKNVDLDQRVVNIEEMEGLLD